MTVYWEWLMINPNIIRLSLIDRYLLKRLFESDLKQTLINMQEAIIEIRKNWITATLQTWTCWLQIFHWNPHPSNHRLIICFSLLSLSNYLIELFSGSRFVNVTGKEFQDPVHKNYINFILFQISGKILRLHPTQLKSRLENKENFDAILQEASLSPRFLAGFGMVSLLTRTSILTLSSVAPANCW